MIAKIIKSWHPDVPVGTEGEVKTFFPKGYGIELTLDFTSTTQPGKRTRETREIYFAKHQVRIPDDEALSS